MTDLLPSLRRIAATRAPVDPGERCEMCARPVDTGHSHVVDLQSRSLLCTCRPCYLLFTAESAELRYRAVPDRYLSFPGLRLGPGAWERLEIPVGLAFVFHNSVLDRDIAFYPGPAGATESQLPLSAWGDVVATEPRLSMLAPDVEALLWHVPDRVGGEPSVHLVPVDVCYELVGRLRQLWRGFDGGQDARRAVAEFFARVQGRARPVPLPDGGARSGATASGQGATP